ncbi:U BOX DOMAIN-CONTAINING [Salix purpurea]|uniref:U BOX DOMAIN-CONTAINING n=1 Tax=Salix purpurea TaxID=77065 RepID=A0A9Q0Q5R9_SALPP|nr:U BOX DOMAIN-CONTAINING [Salix purpurea]
MVSLQDSHSQYSAPNRFPLTSTSPSPIKIHRHVGRSMRTIRSTLFQTSSASFASLPSNSATSTPFVSENLTESVIDMRLGELAKTLNNNSNGNHSSFKIKLSSSSEEEILDIAEAFSDFSGCSPDISGELQRLACLPSSPMHDGEVEGCKKKNPSMEIVAEPCHGFLQRETFSTEIIESISPEDLKPTVNICVDGLQSPSIAVKRSAAEKLRFLAKNRADNRALIGESGAISALIPLLKQSDPWAQEHAVTALLNLSFVRNRGLLVREGAIPPLVALSQNGSIIAKNKAERLLRYLREPRQEPAAASSSSPQ